MINVLTMIGIIVFVCGGLLGNRTALTIGVGLILLGAFIS